MEKYAIIQLGGKQFIVSEGDVFTLEHQSELNISVLLFSDGKTVLVGEPTLSEIKVEAEIVGDENARKIRVGRFRAKSRHRRVYGHTQPLTRVRILSIGDGKAKTAASESAEKAEKPAKKVVKAEKSEKPVAKEAKVKTAKVTETKSKTTKVSKKGAEK